MSQEHARVCGQFSTLRFRIQTMTTASMLSTDALTDPALRTVLDIYHDRIRAERSGPRTIPESGRDGGEDQRMRAIGPETGRVLHALTASLDQPRILEIGTSFGYSTLWFADAARKAAGRVITLEKHAYKSDYAQGMAQRAGLAEHIDFRIGDALELIPSLSDRFDLVFIDLWKDLYQPALEAVIPKLKPNAIIVADNMIRPGSEEIRAYGRAVRAVKGMRSLLLPIGTGLEISVFEGADAYASAAHDTPVR
jgi:predicted O-methyltransferase YrrM